VAYEVVTGADDRATYTLQVESRFAFDAITEVKYNNVLYVNNNPANNGGYRFTAYEWYRNGQPVGTGQYYTAGSARSDMLDALAQYGLTLTTIDGKVMHTCLSATIRPETASALVVYPNPVYRGATATLEYPALSDNTVVRIYTLTGQLIRTQKLTGSRTVLSLPPTFGLYLVTVNGETVTILVE
jgi:hypothetical protein